MIAASSALLAVSPDPAKPVPLDPSDRDEFFAEPQHLGVTLESGAQPVLDVADLPCCAEDLWVPSADLARRQAIGEAFDQNDTLGWGRGNCADRAPEGNTILSSQDSLLGGRRRRDGEALCQALAGCLGACAVDGGCLNTSMQVT